MIPLKHRWTRTPAVPALVHAETMARLSRGSAGKPVRAVAVSVTTGAHRVADALTQHFGGRRADERRRTAHPIDSAVDAELIGDAAILRAHAAVQEAVGHLANRPPECIAIAADRLTAGDWITMHLLAHAVAPWSHTVALTEGSSAPCPSLTLAALRKCLAEGDMSTAEEIADRLSSSSADTESAWAYRSLGDAARVAAGRFDAVDVSTPIPVTIDRRMAAKIARHRGWAETMRRNGNQAEYWFALADECEPVVEGSVGAHYLLNIRSLAALRQGDADRALCMQLQLRSELQKCSDASPQITALNAMNLARLHLRGGELNAAADWLRASFDVSNGCRSVFHPVIEELHWVRIALQRRDRNIAGQHALRAALQWLSCPFPEAISRRAARSVTGEDIEDWKERVDRTSISLLGLLGDGAQEPPSFLRLSEIDRADTCAATEDWAVLLLREEVQQGWSSESFLKLRSIVATRLYDAIPAIREYRTVVIDDIGETLDRPRESAARSGAAFILRVGSQESVAPPPKCNVRVGRGVHRMEDRVVHFRRFLASVELDGADYEVVANPGWREITDSIRRLERDHVVEVCWES